MKVTFAKKLALDKFLKRIDDVILREEILELFIKIGKQGSVAEEDLARTKELLAKTNVSYEDFEELVKRFKR